MEQTRIRTVVVLAVSLLAAACDGRAPTSPTVPAESPGSPPPTLTPPTPSPGVGPSPPRQSNAFEMIGVVTNEVGTPLVGASLEIWVDYGNEHRPTASDLTNARGAYKVTFASYLG